MVAYLIAGVALVVIAVSAFIFKEQIASALQKITGRGSKLESILSVLPETSLKLEESSPGEWTHKNRLEQDEAKLESRGLTHQGYFAHRTQDQFVELSFWKYQEAVTVILCDTTPETESDDNMGDYHIEVIVKLDSGGSLCISNALSADILPRPNEHKLVKTNNQNVFELMKMLKPNTPAGTKVVPIGDCKTIYTDISEAVSTWLWQEKQLTSSAFEEACEALDVSLSDADLDKLINIGKTKLSNAYSNRILQRLERSSQIPGAKWEDLRERLVVVHEKMAAGDISDALYQLVTNLSDEQEELIEAFSTSGQLDNPLESFSELMESLKPNAKRIAKMQRPIVGEVYLSN